MTTIMRLSLLKRWLLSKASLYLLNTSFLLEIYCILLFTNAIWRCTRYIDLIHIQYNTYSNKAITCASIVQCIL